MPYRFMRTICLAGLCLAVPALTGAQDRAACSTDKLAGAWGYTLTGTFIIPGTGPVPAAAVGSHVSRADGNLEGTQHFSLGGTVTRETVTGTIGAEADCTGTMTFEIRDESGGLLRTAVWAVVFDDNGREARAILTSLTLPNGVQIPAVATATARKVFANPVGR